MKVKGFNFIKVVRQDSLYNKYIKWFATGERVEGGGFNFGYRTKADAENFIRKVLTK